MTPLSVISTHAPKLSSFNELLYLDIVKRHLSVICLLPSRFKVFICLNFLMKISMLLSEILMQYARSTSSNWLWWSARASIAPEVSHGHLASFSTFKWLQYSITGCKHFAVRLGQELRFKFINPRLWRNMGIKSVSVMDLHLLRFNTLNLAQLSAKTYEIETKV